jgi:hypothetical protein
MQTTQLITSGATRDKILSTTINYLQCIYFNISILCFDRRYIDKH